MFHSPRAVSRRIPLSASRASRSLRGSAARGNLPLGCLVAPRGPPGGTSRESSHARLHNSCPAPATFSRNQLEDRHLLKRSQRLSRWASSSCALGALLLSHRTAHAD